MAHHQQVQRTQTLHLLPAHPTEVVDLRVEEGRETSTAKVEDEAGPCMQMIGIGITTHVIACLIDRIDREAAQGIPYDAIEIHVMSVIETSTGESATTADSYRGSTTLTLVRRVQNQDHGRLTRTAEAPRLKQDIFLAHPPARSRIRPTTRLLTDMDRLWIPTRDVLQLQ